MSETDRFDPETKLFQELETMYRRVAAYDHFPIPARSDSDREDNATEPTGMSATAPPQAPPSRPDPPPPARNAEGWTSQIILPAGAIRYPESEAPPPGHPLPRPRPGRWGLGLSLTGGILLVSLGLLLWPSLYDYRSLQWEDQVYPLRTHRLTGETAYYDGGQWKPPPIPSAAAAKTRETPIPLVKTVVPPVQAPPPASSAPTAPATVPPTPPKRPEAVRSLPPAPARGIYAIQIKAVTSREEAMQQLEELKKTVLDVHWTAVDLPQRGTWYRILIGRFTAEGEAKKYLEERRIRELYPDSFIQTLPEPAPDKQPPLRS